MSAYGKTSSGLERKHAPDLTNFRDTLRWLSVHGFIYGIQDGILHDLHTTVRHGSEITAQYEVAISALGRRSVDIK